MSNSSYRFAIVALNAFAAFLLYATRTNINNAIVSMTRDQIAKKSGIIADYCPVFPEDDENVSRNASSIGNMLDQAEMLAPTYNWSPTTQGVILGAYFYGYIALQIPAGKLSETYGGKNLVTVGLTCSGFITLMTPWITDSLPALITSRVLLGLMQSAIFPACFSINANWMPVEEKSLGFGMVHAGANLGALFASATTGLVSRSFGWPYSFFGLGLLTMLWTLTFWLLLVKSQPDSPSLIHILKRQCDKISPNSSPAAKQAACSRCSIDILINDKSSNKHSVPWIKILTNPAALSACACRVCVMFGYLTLQTTLPKYMNSVLHLSEAQNGILNSFVYLSTSITMASGPFLSEVVISRGWLSTTVTRKLFSGVASYGLTMCFLLLPYMGCSVSYTISVLIAGMFLYGLSLGGDMIVPAEISQHFATTIFATINTLAHAMGIIAPLIIGVILEGATDGIDLKQRWDWAFSMCAAIVATGATIYMIFGSSEKQDFDRIEVHVNGVQKRKISEP